MYNYFGLRLFILESNDAMNEHHCKGRGTREGYMTVRFGTSDEEECCNT